MKFFFIGAKTLHFGFENLKDHFELDVRYNQSKLN